MAFEDTASPQNLALLEARLHRINHALNGDNEHEAASSPPPADSSAALRLRTLERQMQLVASRSPAAEQVLRLQSKHPELFNKAIDAERSNSLPLAPQAALVLSHAQLYSRISGQLQSLQDTSVPDASSAAKLRELQPRIEKAAARQEKQAEELAELRSRSADVVERWYETGVLGMGERWVEWEERMRDVEIVVRRLEGAKKREEELVFGHQRLPDPGLPSLYQRRTGFLQLCGLCCECEPRRSDQQGRSAAGATSKSPIESVVAEAQAQYEAAVAAASSQMMYASTYAHDAIYGTTPAAYDQAASAASTAIFGSQTPFMESMASRAEENWESLIAQASDQIYGQPPPFTDAVYSSASSVYAQATEGAVFQYEAVQSLFSELISEREPEFTESVMSRLHSAYHTGAPDFASAASSYAEDAYQSASSVVSSVWTPPPTIEAVLDSVAEQIESAVDAASAQVYGTSKGSYEQASSAASSAYSSASDAIYGTETGYAEAAQSNIGVAAESASRAISEALFGTSTGPVQAATAAVAEQVEAAREAISSALYGEAEQGAMESAASRISDAVESARSRMGEFAAKATEAVAGEQEDVKHDEL